MRTFISSSSASPSFVVWVLATSAPVVSTLIVPYGVQTHHGGQRWMLQSPSQPQQCLGSLRVPSSTFLLAKKTDCDDADTKPNSDVFMSANTVLRRYMATGLLAAALTFSNLSPQMGNVVLPVPGGVAQAKEMASASGSRVNKDPESLLRYGLPIQNKEVRQLQAVVENIRNDVTSKRKTAAVDGAKEVKKFVGNKKSEKISAACGAKMDECSGLLTTLSDTTGPLMVSLKESMDALQGSEQERTALDNAYKSQTKMADLMTQIEERMVPPAYVTPVPDLYDDLPQLKGRAKVEFVLQKPDGAPFDIEGTNFKEARMVMVIDGFTAPVTGGNFVDLVDRGFYTKMAIQRSDGFVVQTGRPMSGDAEGFVTEKVSKSVGKGPKGERLIPSEIFIKGDAGPIYETTIEDEGRGGQATVLPFSSYGAMGWAREEYDVNSGSSQFFWLLFDSDLTPAGKNVLDGRYPCFGYVVEGADFLRDIKEGDLIVSAKVTDGLDLLKRPS